MGVAVSSGKIGFAYLVDGELMDWKLSIEASRSEEAAFQQATKWIGYYELDAVVLESPEESRKGELSLALGGAVSRAAVALGVIVVALPRKTKAANKYIEANALALEFPQVAPWLPTKRRLWEKEPRYIILFEALSLAWNWWRSLRQGEEGDTIDW